ncbi:MAG: phosphate ABC transporter substrate-binding protein PstS [Tepidibacillus sp.]
MNFKKLSLLFLSLVVIFTLGACAAQNQPNQQGGEQTQQGGDAAGKDILLNGAGSSFVNPLLQRMIPDYANAKGVKVNYQSIGSGGGIQQLIKKTVDFAASDAPMKEDEINQAGGNVLHIPVTLGGVAVTYNLEGVDKLKLTPQVLGEIYTGKITKWNDKKITDINPGVNLPDEEIKVTHRSDGSGTTYIFTSYLNAAVPEIWGDNLVGKSIEWPVEGIGAKGNEGVAGQIQNEPGTIGYVELAYVIENKMTAVELQNKDGNFVAPTLETVSAAAAGAVANMPEDMKISLVNQPGANSYPIVGTTWLLVYENSPMDKERTQQVVDFLKYAVTEGQKFAEELQYAPLPKEIQDLDVKQLDKVQVK